MKCPCTVVVPTVCAKYLSASISSSQLPDVSLHAETFEKPVNQSGDGAIIVNATISVESHPRRFARLGIPTTRVADTHYASTPLAWWLPVRRPRIKSESSPRSPRRPSPRPTPSGRSRTASKRSRARRPPWESSVASSRPRPARCR